MVVDFYGGQKARSGRMKIWMNWLTKVHVESMAIKKEVAIVCKIYVQSNIHLHQMF